MESCTCTDVPITIFRGDDTDGLGYQSIKGKITTVLDLTGCKAVFRYLGFTQTIDPIPESGRFIITIPSDITAKFPPGMGFASLRVYDQQGKVRTFTNRIPVFVTMTAPAVVGGDFTVEFSGGALNLEPLKIWTVDGFVDYDGYAERIIDKATADRFGLAMLKDTFESGDDADSGIAATPKSVNAAYAAILAELTDNYYTAEETEEKIDSLAAYYITSNAAGDAFPTKNALVTETTYYSGGVVRIPTRNDYAVVLADETHGGEEWRYIYATNGESGQWEAQYPIETNDYETLSNKPSINGVTLSGDKTSSNLGLLGNSGNQTLDGSLQATSFKAPNANGGYISLGCEVEDAYLIYSRNGTGDARIDIPSVTGTLALTSDIAVKSVKLNGTALTPDANGAVDVQALPLTGGEISGNLLVNGRVDISAFFTISKILSSGLLFTGMIGNVERRALLPLFAISDSSNFTIAFLQNIAPYYNETSTYKLNTLCVHSSRLYRCMTAITTAEEWTAAHWTEVTVEDILEVIRSALDAKASLASPAFTGTPTAPTPTAGDDSTKVATTAFVQGAVGAIKTFQHDAGGYYIEVEAS